MSFARSFSHMGFQNNKNGVFPVAYSFSNNKSEYRDRNELTKLNGNSSKVVPSIGFLHRHLKWAKYQRRRMLNGNDIVVFIYINSRNLQISVFYISQTEICMECGESLFYMKDFPLEVNDGVEVIFVYMKLNAVLVTFLLQRDDLIKVDECQH